jgi:hypothetical protein
MATGDHATWEPYREPLPTTLRRTFTIALVIGALLARVWNVGGAGGWPNVLTRWGAATLVALWPAFGGHWVELWFLNVLRLRLPASRGAQLVARLAVWFVAGTLLAFGMALTTMALPAIPRFALRTALLFGGVGFIAVELLAHLALQLGGRPSVYNGRG